MWFNSLVNSLIKHFWAWLICNKILRIYSDFACFGLALLAAFLFFSLSNSAFLCSKCKLFKSNAVITLSLLKWNFASFPLLSTNGRYMSIFPSLNRISVGSCFDKAESEILNSAAISGKRPTSTFPNFIVSNVYLEIRKWNN